MNGRPNGIGGRAEGSGGRYGWLRHTCQFDLSYMCARTHASHGAKAACIPGAHTARPCKIYCNNGHINTRLLFFSFSSSFLSFQSVSYATFSAFTPVRSFYSTMHTCRTTFQDPCAHLFQVDLFQTTLLASCRRRACQA